MGLQNKTILLKKQKCANLLTFKFSLDGLNMVFECLKNGAWISPVDLKIFKMGAHLESLNGYYVMLSSKKFPLVEEGERVKDGEVEFVRGVHRTTMTFKEIKHGE